MLLRFGVAGQAQTFPVKKRDERSWVSAGRVFAPKHSMAACRFPAKKIPVGRRQEIPHHTVPPFLE
jgi:hypothetical protein